MNHFCREASQLQSDGFERELTIGERIRLRMHLLICGACRNYATNIAFLHNIFHSIQNRKENDASIVLSESARTRIKEALKNNTNPES